MKGRNKFKKKCYVCDVEVPAYEGFLNKKNGKWVVIHPTCKEEYDHQQQTSLTEGNTKTNVKTPVYKSRRPKPPPAPKTPKIELEDDILSYLERTLEIRKELKHPIIKLPLIIDYIKGLQAKIVELTNEQK